jgi:hypothetical protein
MLTVLNVVVNYTALRKGKIWLTLTLNLLCSLAVTAGTGIRPPHIRPHTPYLYTGTRGRHHVLMQQKILSMQSTGLASGEVPA